MTTVSTNSTAGRSANAGGRVRSGNGGHVVDYGVIGNGVVASVGQPGSLGCGRILALVGWSHFNFGGAAVVEVAACLLVISCDI